MKEIKEWNNAKIYDTVETEPSTRVELMEHLSKVHELGFDVIQVLESNQIGSAEDGLYIFIVLVKRRFDLNRDRAQVVSEGFAIADNIGYNRRMVFKDANNDLYYTGWMDCFDWIAKNTNL